MDELQVTARPLPGRRADGAAHPDAGVAQSVAAARRAAQLLRVVAWSIPIVSLVGDLLTTFWIDDEGFAGVSVRHRIGGVLSFLWVPIALGALVYAASFVLTLYAARIELDTTRPERPVDR